MKNFFDIKWDFSSRNASSFPGGLFLEATKLCFELQLAQGHRTSGSARGEEHGPERAARGNLAYHIRPGPRLQKPVLSIPSSLVDFVHVT